MEGPRIPYGQDIVEEDPLHRLYQHVKQDLAARLSLHGFDLSITYHEEHEQLTCITSVFSGGNYIPQSVRHAVKRTSLALDTSELLIDEERFQVHLVYRHVLPALTEGFVSEAVEAFLMEADEWRSLLDDYGQHDLVYAHQRI